MPQHDRKRVNLTATAIRALEPRHNPYTVWDSEVRGLLVQVSPGGTIRWCIDYADKHTGRRVRRMIGDVSVLTTTQARKGAKEYLGAVSSGKDPFANEDAAKLAGTFRDAAEAFLKAKEGEHAANTIRSRRTALMVHACKHFGKRPLLAVGRDDVRREHVKLAKTQPVTANRMVQAMRLVYGWANETGRLKVPYDPTVGVRLAREPKQHRVFSSDEYRQIEDALDDEANVRDSAIAACECLRFIMLTGRRRDEVRTLKWSDVDLDRGVMRGIATKTGRKSFPIPPPALAVLQRMRKRPVISTWVFPSPVDRSKPVHNVNLVWDRVKALAGIEGRARIHDMRHSFAGSATALGLPIQSVAQLLGQDNVGSASRYAGAHEDHARELAAQVSTRIGEAMGKGGRP